MPGSKNKLIIASLVETFKYKVENSKLYDALQKIASDLNKVYEALFDGPLPAVNGKFLNLTEVPNSSFSESIAFKDEANTFTEDQTIIKDFPTFLLYWANLAIKARMTQTADGGALFSGNLYFDGTDWQVDDDVFGSGIQFNSGAINLMQFNSGTAILAFPIRIDTDKIIRIGEPVFYTDAAEHEIVLANDKGIRGSNSTDSFTLPIIELDGNDLVSIGSNPVGATTGEGNISIPRSDTVDLPLAGATRNGILILDKGTGRLCYYVNGLRYKLAIGTAF